MPSLPNSPQPPRSRKTAPDASTVQETPTAKPPRTRKKGHRGDHEGSFYQTRDGIWRATILVGRRADGKPDRRTVSAKTRAACQEKLDELRQSLKDGTLGDPAAGRTTVAEFLTTWLTTIQASVRPRTWDRYDEMVRHHLIPSLGHRRLRDLRPQHVQAFYAAAANAGAAPRSVVKMHAVLHRALQQAEKWGTIGRNVVDVVEKPKAGRTELTLPTLSEVKGLLSTAVEGNDPLVPLWTLAVYSGCRLGELLALQWPDVDLESRMIAVHRTLVAVNGVEPVFGEPKTTRSRRTVSLPAEAVEALHRHHAAERMQQAMDRV